MTAPHLVRLTRWMAPLPLSERISRRAEPDLNSGCLLWSGAVSNRGYGVICVDNRPRAAHRVAYEVHRGPIPDGMILLHSCDTPSCVNPDHLRVGTVKDNTADMMAKGRQKFGPGKPFQKGERGHRAVLSETEARAIESDPRSVRVLANEYGVAESTVRHIKNHTNWKHLWRTES
jgi:hypothetical protein